MISVLRVQVDAGEDERIQSLATILAEEHPGVELSRLRRAVGFSVVLSTASDVWDHIIEAAARAVELCRSMDGHLTATDLRVLDYGVEQEDLGQLPFLSMQFEPRLLSELAELGIALELTLYLQASDASEP